MLVCGGMEENGRPVFGNRGRESRDIRHIAEDRMDKRTKPLIIQLLGNQVETVFMALIEDKRFRAQGGDLSRQFRSMEPPAPVINTRFP